MTGIADFELMHVASGAKITMPLVIVSFESRAKPNWASTAVYGRMDPIFTYQNTVRTFTAVLRTPRGGEKFTETQKQVLIDSKMATEAQMRNGQLDKDGKNYYPAVLGIVEAYLPKIADLYKMMYPMYRPEGPNRSTGFMTAAPLMTLNLEGIAYDGLKGAGASSLGNGMLFVPETFTVNSLVDSEKTTISVGSAADLRFYANSEGYTITLGGTVLHRDQRVGFMMAGDTISFGQGANFPYNTGDQSLFADPAKSAPPADEDYVAGLEACLARKPDMTNAAYIDCINQVSTAHDPDLVIEDED